MAALTGELRALLERKVVTARQEAERGARAALETIGVERKEAFPGTSNEDRQLRIQLRARARQLGEGSFEAGLEPLVEEIAYEGWHRMLFARFLAENNLLMHPSGVPVTLEECAELAQEEGEPDAWSVAACYAGAMLPGIFRQDDPSSRVRFAPEGRNALERILNELPTAVFAADDALGWVYQFWQSKEKKRVNDSGVKIGAKELPAVTQLFTEDYMVRFLLENSLGAWWAARHPESPLIKEWEYLRVLDDGTPAAGKFEGWPDRAAEVTMMDPCCGSGHFLVAAFDMFRKMRMEEESLTETMAGDAVLADNVNGLEIDGRCAQIAAFALAFAAWKAGGYRSLPAVSIACSGLPVKGQLADWTKLAGSDVNLRITLEQLYQLFREAPLLGSLIDPISSTDPLFRPPYHIVELLIHRAVIHERRPSTSGTQLSGTSAGGTARAAALLAANYTLIATNVPFLNEKRQVENLRVACKTLFPDSRADLATAFIERCIQFCHPGGTACLVTTQNWLFLGSYKKLRQTLLSQELWRFLVRLGKGAFTTPLGAIPVLTIIDRGVPSSSAEFRAIDVSLGDSICEKIRLLKAGQMIKLHQFGQLDNPHARIEFSEQEENQLLCDYADCSSGMLTGDGERFYKLFWEPGRLRPTWEYLQSTVSESIAYGGRSHVVLWQGGYGDLYNLAQQLRHVNHAVQNWRRGQELWGKAGIAVRTMGSLPCTLYTGERFDSNTAVICPHDPANTPAVWAFCASPSFHDAVRQFHQKLNVDVGYIASVPFDLDFWRRVAEERGPLPVAHSIDPTQWLFEGNPADSTEPLQVAVARLLGYRWPEQDSDHLTRFADDDGIVPLVPILKEQPAAERLRALLAAAFGDGWSTARQDELLAQAGFAGKDLHAWLRDGFFAQHCKAFHNRPFIWQIWDGTRDGFSALVNYHKLDTATLERLIFTYLGAWIDRQRGERDAEVAGAEGRLVAALKLQEKLIEIREGEKPYDIYVRWKPKHEQPIGWAPDLNDGVRLNIRPFVEASVLRKKPTAINWKKDRGTNPDGSERLNYLHLTLAEKRAARQAAGVA
jgi:hypothetical protein